MGVANLNTKDKTNEFYGCSLIIEKLVYKSNKLKVTGYVKIKNNIKIKQEEYIHYLSDKRNGMFESSWDDRPKVMYKGNIGYVNLVTPSITIKKL